MSPALGEEEGIFNCALFTSGAFTFMSAGGFEKAELGEPAQGQCQKSLWYLQRMMKRGGVPAGSPPVVAPSPPASSAKWEGSFSSTSAEEKPKFTKGGSPKDPHCQGCKTVSGRKCTRCREQKCATAIPHPLAKPGTGLTTWGQSHQCTSCQKRGVRKDPLVFLLTNHKSKSGLCRKYAEKPVVKCAQLNSDYPPAPDHPNKVCTKVSKSKAVLRVKRILDREARKHFESVQGLHNAAVAICSIWKQTVCIGVKCNVKKEVKCMDVCPLWKFPNLYFPAKCGSRTGKDLCAGKYGALACKESAMMA